MKGPPFHKRAFSGALIQRGPFSASVRYVPAATDLHCFKCSRPLTIRKSVLGSFINSLAPLPEDWMSGWVTQEKVPKQLYTLELDVFYMSGICNQPPQHRAQEMHCTILLCFTPWQHQSQAVLTQSACIRDSTSQILNTCCAVYLLRLFWIRFVSLQWNGTRWCCVVLRASK